MNIYVGNLSYDVTEDELKEAFEAAGGEVVSTRIIIDKFTGKSKGFAFVELTKEKDDAGESIIKKLDGQELRGRNMKVNEARTKPQSGAGRRSGGFNRGGNGYNGGGRGRF
jgi:RNA recognition motif-containing protein